MGSIIGNAIGLLDHLLILFLWGHASNGYRWRYHQPHEPQIAS